MSLGIGRNTVTLLSASVVQKATAFVYFALIARWAGVEDTGKYFFALSWTLLFSVVTDAGLTPVLIREAAKSPEHAKRFLSQVISIKIPLTVAAMTIVVLGVWLMGYPPVTRQMVSLAAIVLALDAVSLTFYGFLRGHHMLKYEALGLVLSQAIAVAVGVWTLKTGQPIQYLIIALICGSAYNAAQAVFFTWKRLGVLPRLMWDAAFAKTMLKAAIPFALAGAFVKIYNSVDAVMLSKFIGDEATGLYAVPFKLTFAFQFIPMAFTAALYPAMSRYHAVDRERLGGVLYKGMRYLALIVFPLVLGGMALSKDIIFAVYGSAYAPSVLALQILIVTLVAVFLDFPLGSMLNATGRQMTQTKLMGLATVVSVVMNLILIPRFSFMGAVFASLVSHFVLFAGGLIVVNGFLKWPHKALFADIVRIVCSSAVMVFAVLVVKRFLPLPVTILVGAAVYVGAGLLVKAYGVAEIREVLATFIRRKARA